MKNMKSYSNTCADDGLRGISATHTRKPLERSGHTARSPFVNLIFKGLRG